MKKSIFYQFKRLLNKLHYHRETGKKDIFIFSTFRSGSTWLAEIIKSQPKIKFPISPNKIEFLNNIEDYYKKIKPRPFYINLSVEEKQVLKDYIKKTSRGELVYGRRYTDLFSPHHSFISERSVFRLLRSSYLLDWFNNNFDIHIIYLFRHPIAASLSRKKIWENSSNPSYWSPNNDYLLKSDYIRKKYLTSKNIKYLKIKLKNCNRLEEFVITWCLENLPVIRKIQSLKHRPDFIVLTYEDLLMNPGKVISFLCQKLHLADEEKMLAQLQIPSSTVRYSDDRTKNNFENRTYDQNYLLKKWKKEISDETEKSIFAILKKFQIEIYCEGNFIPSRRFLVE
ncbi:MAG: sulfotransferase domain-containing protein [Halanaerobiales bacterium]